MPSYNNYPNGYGYSYPTLSYGPQQSNNQYGYMNQTPQMIQQFPQQPSYNYEQPQGSSSVVWVQGEAGANAYPVGKGQTVMLIDANPNSNMFYLKSADAYSGRPLPLEKYRYTRVYDDIQNESHQSMDASPVDKQNYVSTEEFNNLKAQLEKLQKTLDDLTK